jgi:hypothetical protein
MKYAVEIVSVTMIHIASFIKIGSDVQKLLGGGYTDVRDSMETVSLIEFIENKESSLKTVNFAHTVFR